MKASMRANCSLRVDADCLHLESNTVKLLLMVRNMEKEKMIIELPKVIAKSIICCGRETQEI